MTNQIPAWQLDNGELGLGQVYNINWAPKTQLIHLDSGRNLNYANRVNLKKGRYDISLDWAARDGRNLDTSQVIVRLNGEDRATLVPKDYYCHRHSFTVDLNDGNHTLELVGAGNADNYGATIDNVVFVPSRR